MMPCHRVRRASCSVLVASVVAVLSMAGLGACGGSDTLPSPKAAAGDAVLARVDGEEVTQAQVDAIRAEARLAGRDDGAGAARDEAVRRVLVRLEAERLGIRVADDAVRQRVSDLEEKAGGGAALDAALEKAVMTRDQLAEAVGHSLLTEAVADAKNAHLEASPGQVRAFYDRHREDLYTTAASYRLGKITVPREKLAEELVRRLRSGASFPALARRYSMDQQTRYQGGDLGWVSAFTVPQEVLAVVEGVAPGGIAEPVWSSGKWQVFQVVARRPSRVVPFAEARDAIARELTRRRRAHALDRWIDEKLERVEVVTAP